MKLGPLAFDRRVTQTRIEYTLTFRPTEHVLGLVWVTSPDPHPQLHDSPSPAWELVLRGHLQEVRPTPAVLAYWHSVLQVGQQHLDHDVLSLTRQMLGLQPAPGPFRVLVPRSWGSFFRRPARLPFRVASVSRHGVWMAVLRFPPSAIRRWGFWTADGWVPHEKFLFADEEGYFLDNGDNAGLDAGPLETR